MEPNVSNLNTASSKPAQSQSRQQRVNMPAAVAAGAEPGVAIKGTPGGKTLV